jgi:hypothetical protein
MEKLQQNENPPEHLPQKSPLPKPSRSDIRRAVRALSVASLSLRPMLAVSSDRADKGAAGIKAKLKPIRLDH